MADLNRFFCTGTLVRSAETHAENDQEGLFFRASIDCGDGRLPIVMPCLLRRRKIIDRLEADLWGGQVVTLFGTLEQMPKGDLRFLVTDITPHILDEIEEVAA